MAVGLDKIPRFTMERLTEIEGRVRAAGRLDRRARLGIGMADVYAGNDILLSGRIVELRGGLIRPIRGLHAVFETEDTRARDLLRKDQAYPVFDGYWGERAQLVLDGTRNWRRRVFESSTGAWNPASGVMRKAEDTTGHPAEILEPGAWDHEHCAICWESISQAEGEQHEGYVDQNGIWVCIPCFETFVAPKNLAFPIDK